MQYKLRDFQLADSHDVNRISLAAFSQYKDYYTNWPALSNKIANMTLLAEQAEIIVATLDNKIIGAVGYVPPAKPKLLFPLEWPVIRMLVVDPYYRGLGIGKSLTEECIQRAMRDTASLIALHTSPMMEIALGMYLRMGFVFERETSPIHGVPYNIYIKQLTILE